MLIACVASASEAQSGADVILLPEYTSLAEFDRAANLFPNAAIVGAFQAANRSRAILLHKRKNLLNYTKVGTDGRTDGLLRHPVPLPVVELGNSCLGVLICMDIDSTELLRAVVARISASPAPHKLLCVPASMGSWWLSSTELTPEYRGVNVALCNDITYPGRRQSFIADSRGQFVLVQRALEPLHHEFPS